MRDFPANERQRIKALKQYLIMPNITDKKILFITRGRSSRGGHVVLTQIVRTLRTQGYDVTLVTFESKEQMIDDVPYWENMDVCCVEVPHSDDMQSEQIGHIKAISLYAKENFENFDIIIIDSWFVALGLIRENIFSDKIFQLVQSNPAFLPKNQNEFWKAELLNMLPLIPMQRIVVSKALAEYFKEKYKKDFFHLSLFVDDAYLKGNFTVKDSQILKIVSSSATFNIETKGLDFLFNQLEKIKEFKFELTLISGEKIKKSLSGYSFPISVKSAKSSTEMVEELCKHDIYINTSSQEAFCLALAEAIALGVPSLALDSVGNREYINRDNAIFVANPEEFISELLKLENFEFRKKLSLLAKKSMQKYTLENTITQLKKIIDI